MEETLERNMNVGQTERLVSAVAGAALAIWGLKRRSLPGLVVAAMGGALACRGVTGKSRLYERYQIDTAAGTIQPEQVELTRVVSVMKDRREVYAFWRKLDNLPTFMRHLESVTILDDRRSRWVAATENGLVRATWEAEITEDREGEVISWRSVPGSSLHNEGEVRFQDAPGGRGTEVRVRLAYRPPAGGPGRLAGKLLNPVFARLLMSDIRAFKSLVEAGELPTIEQQSQGAKSRLHVQRAEPSGLPVESAEGAS